MRQYIWIYIFFLAFASYSQESLKITVFSEKEQLPLENVLVYNSNGGSFSYTNERGKVNALFEDERDSIMITIPGYTDKKQTIADLKLKEGKVQLSLKVENLPLVYISSKKAEYSCKMIAHSKRKNYTRATSSGAAFVSYYKHAKCGNCNLNSILFYFDNSSISPNEKIYIRPLIYEVQDGKMIPLIETPYAILLSPKQNNVLINLTNAEIRFEDNKEYLIGFEVINGDNSEKVISFRLATHRNNYSLFRANPMVPWYDFRDSGSRFSLDYEVYFDHCK